MFQYGGCAVLMCGLPGMGTNLHHLAERAERFSGYLGGVIRTCVCDHSDPQ
jgi:hypothetical protein